MPRTKFTLMPKYTWCKKKKEKKKERMKKKKL